jgi:FixJ family two-component response regulator
MPQMGGPALQKELARRGRHFPVVFIRATQRGSSLAVDRGGAIDVLVKPFAEPALLDAIVAALRPA